MQLHERLNWAYAQDGLRTGAKLLLVTIAHRVDAKTLKTWIGETKLCALTGMAERTLRDHLIALETLALVHVDRRPGKTSIITMLPTPAESAGHPGNSRRTTPAESAGHPGNSRRVSTQDQYKVSGQYQGTQSHSKSKPTSYPPTGRSASKSRRPALTDEEIGGLVNDLAADYEARNGPSKQAFAEWIEHVTDPGFAWNTRTETAIRRHLGRWMRNRL